MKFISILINKILSPIFVIAADYIRIAFIRSNFIYHYHYLLFSKLIFIFPPEVVSVINIQKLLFILWLHF